MANPRHMLSGGCVAGVEDLNEEDVTETESPAVTAAITAAITTPFGYKVRELVCHSCHYSCHHHTLWLQGES
jgi:hypothetical protein